MNNKTIKDTRIYCTQGPDNLPATGNGTLDNLTFVFKDLFDVAGYVTGAGNPAWLSSHQKALNTSPLIDTLLANGADCIGRVQTDELAYSLNGQNIHYGTPINPKAPNCLPGGSSSGSAVAVATGDADFSIGTDTGGSVRVPASYCGLFGLRPTLGKLNLDNAFQLSKSFDTAGIFSRDLLLLSTVFTVLDEQPQPLGKPATTLYLDKTLAAQITAERLKKLNEWCEQSNIILAESDMLMQTKQTPETLSLLFRTIQGYDIIQGHDAWLKEHGDSLDPSIMQRVNWARTITDTQYQKAKKQQQAFTNTLVALFQKMDGLWVLPTTPSGAPSLTLMGDALAHYRSQLMGLTSIAGLAGFPQLHLPIPGLAEGPCGFSLMGVADTESDLFATAFKILQGEKF